MIAYLSVMICKTDESLQWRHNGHHGISNHQPYDCLLNRVFKAQIKGNFKAPRHWPLCWEIFLTDYLIVMFPDALAPNLHHIFSNNYVNSFMTTYVVSNMAQRVCCVTVIKQYMLERVRKVGKRVTVLYACLSYHGSDVRCVSSAICRPYMLLWA